MTKSRNFIKKLFESGSNGALLTALSIFLGALITGVYGVYLLVDLILAITQKYPDIPPSFISTRIIIIIDIHLLSVIQYVFAVGLYELFIGNLNLPKWLSIKNIEELKAKLASVIVLILAIKFTEKAMQWNGGIEIMYLAIALALIIFVLTFYYRVKGERQDQEIN